MEKFSFSLILHFSYCISLYIHSTFKGMLENFFDTVIKQCGFPGWLRYLWNYKSLSLVPPPGKFFNQVSVLITLSPTSSLFAQFHLVAYLEYPINLVNSFHSFWPHPHSPNFPYFNPHFPFPEALINFHHII